MNVPQFSNIEVPYEKILARLGFAKEKTQIDGKTENIINEEIETSKKLIIARQSIACSEIKIIDPGRISLEPGLVIISNDIYNLLKDCAFGFGFTVTIGPHLEEKRNQYINIRETARALILDAIGSVTAEELAEITQNQIAEDASKEGLKITRRFSPGYGDWNLSGQKDFLKWLGAENIGIKLTPNFQMLPEKSVSAILGTKK